MFFDIRLRGRVQDVSDVEEVDELRLEADIVHDEYLVVRSIVGEFLGESFVGDQDYDTCTKKSSCPKQHAEDLDEDRNYVELLLLVGILHDLNESSDGTRVQDDNCHD